MKHKLAVAIAVCILALALVGWTMSRPAPMQWEYRIVSVKDARKTDKNNEDLNALGAQGWELVSIERETQEGTSFPGATFYFKRQKQ